MWYLKINVIIEALDMVKNNIDKHNFIINPKKYHLISEFGQSEFIYLLALSYAIISGKG